MDETPLPRRDAHRLLRLLSFAAACVLVRLLLLARIPLSGDEGVFGLMALAIGRGDEYPLYCWGAHYASALVSYIAVPSIAFFGLSSFALKAPLLLYNAALTALLAAWLERTEGRGPAFLAALFWIFPLPALLEYSVAANGGHAETYLLGPAIWITALGLAAQPSAGLFLLFGFLCGLSFAILWLGIPFILSAVVLLAARRRLLMRPAWAGLAGGAVGSVPFWAYNLFQAPGATFLRLGARSLEVTNAAQGGLGLAQRITGLPRWCAESWSGWGKLFVVPGGAWIAAAVVAATVAGALKLHRRRDDRGLLSLSFLASLLVFNFAGNLTRERHWATLVFVPLLAWPGFSRRTNTLLLAAFVALSAPLSVSSLFAWKPDPRPARIAEVLDVKNADGLIADYDLGYPAAFLSGGRIPLASVAPPNVNDRRPDWTEAVGRARRPALLLLRADSVRFLAAGDPVSFELVPIGDRDLILPELDGTACLERVHALAGP